MVKGCDVILINPPGWILSAGGPYIALPLLKSALAKNCIYSKVIDVNLESILYYNIKISTKDLERVKNKYTLNSLNDPYYRAQEKMQKLASVFSADWDIQLGYTPEGFDYSSSESVRKFSKNESVYSRYYKNKLIPEINIITPRLIGISITVPQQLLPTFELCRALRSSGYDGHIVLGGNMVTRIGDNMKLSWVFKIINGFVLFSGEQSITEYFNCISENRSFSHVSNLVWKDKCKIIKNNIKYIKKDKFVDPDYTDIKIDEYWGYNYLPLLGSRGCYYGKCKFCSIPYSYGNKGFLGHDDPLRVFKNMSSYSSDYGIRNYKFMEESMYPLTIKKISEKILTEEVECRFEGYARFDDSWMDSKYLKLVSMAGLKKIYLGLELYQSSNRNLLNKSDSSCVVEMLKMFNDVGIKVHLFTLFGYPGTGVDEAIETIHFALGCDELIDTLDIFPFTYAKHTEIPCAIKKIDKRKDWAVEYDYIPGCNGVLSQNEVLQLSERLEEIIWSEKPKWLHPIYRMISPFGFSKKNI